MNEQEIKVRLVAIETAMAAKGMASPEAQGWIRCNTDVTIYLSWAKPESHSKHDHNSKFLRGKDMREALDASDAWVRDQEGSEQRAYRHAIQAVASAKEALAAAGIEGFDGEDYVASLTLMMTRLSENAITDQSGEA